MKLKNFAVTNPTMYHALIEETQHMIQSCSPTEADAAATILIEAALIMAERVGHLEARFGEPNAEREMLEQLERLSLQAMSAASDYDIKQDWDDDTLPTNNEEEEYNDHIDYDTIPF